MVDVQNSGAAGGVKYATRDKNYFEKRGLQRYAGVWSLWALGVGAVISGHFSGWNFGFADRRLGRHAGGRHHHRHHVSGAGVLDRRNEPGAAAYGRGLFVRPHLDGPLGRLRHRACSRTSNTC